MSKKFHPKNQPVLGEVMTQDEFVYCMFVSALKNLRNREAKNKALESGVNTGFKKWTKREIDLEFQKTGFWDNDYFERY